MRAFTNSVAVHRCATAVLLSVAAIAATAGTAAADTILFDSFSGGASTSSRSAGNSPGTYIITVASDTTINRISVLNDLASAGDLKFLIFEHPSHTLLLSTAAKSFADDGIGPSWKTSDAFGFTLLAGTQYDIGAIADVAGLWNFDLSATTQNGISSTNINVNFNDYAAPHVGSHGSADAAVRLIQTDAITAVPLPATAWAGLALCGAVGLARLSRAASVPEA